MEGSSVPAQEALKTYELPLFPVQLVLYPGTYQPLNIFEPWTRALINHCLSSPDPQFGMIYRDPTSTVTTDIGTIVRIHKAYFDRSSNSTTITPGLSVRTSNPQSSSSKSTPDRFIVLVQATRRFRLLSTEAPVEATETTPGSKYAFPIATIQDYSDAPASNEDTISSIMRNTLRVLEEFTTKCGRNSMWKVITQRLGDTVPTEPQALSFWLAASLTSTEGRGGIGAITDQKKVRLLEMQDVGERLKLVTEWFKRYPPVRNTLRESSNAVLEYDHRMTSSSLSRPSEGIVDGVRQSLIFGRRECVKDLRDLCISFVCDHWNEIIAPESTGKSGARVTSIPFESVPIDLVEKVLIQFHRTERMSKPILEALKHRYPSILTSLETLFLSEVPGVDNTWLELLHSCTNLTFLDLSHSYKITDTGLSNCIKRFPHLRSLYIDRCRSITEAGLRVAPTSCPNVSSLRVSGTRIQDALFQRLRGLWCHLRDVDISGTGIGDETVKFLVHIRPPEELLAERKADKHDKKEDQLDEEECAEEKGERFVYGKGVRPIAIFRASRTQIKGGAEKHLPLLAPTLHTLDLSFVHGIANWQFLSNLVNLVHLDISLNGNFVTDEVAPSLAKLVSLTHLTMSNTSITDVGVRALSTLVDLTLLDLSKTVVSHHSLTLGVLPDQGDANGQAPATPAPNTENPSPAPSNTKNKGLLQSLKKLTHLYLQYTNVNEELVPGLKSLESLYALKLTGCPAFGDSALIALTTNLEIEEELEGVEDGWGERVKRKRRCFDTLAALDIGSELMGDEGLAHIGELRGLKNLGLWNTKVTERGAKWVQETTGLAPNCAMRTTKGTYLFQKAEEAM